MSVSKSGMADCRVRRVGEELRQMGMSQTHTCMQPGPAHTAYLLASVRATFCVFPHGYTLRLARALRAARIPITLFTFLECTSSWYFGEPARVALDHGAFDPHVPGHVGVGVACDGLRELSLKEGHLISTKSCQH